MPLLMCQSLPQAWMATVAWSAGVAQQRSVWKHPQWLTPAAVYLGDRGNNSNSVRPAPHSETPPQNRERHHHCESLVGTTHLWTS